MLLSYEYEATTAIKKGEKGIELVRPDSRIEIEIDIAPEGQRKFVGWGYRPVDPEVAAATRSRFPNPPKVTTIPDLGGWSKVNEGLFDPEKGSIAKIEEEAGVSTAR